MSPSATTVRFGSVERGRRILVLVGGALVICCLTSLASVFLIGGVRESLTSAIGGPAATPVAEAVSTSSGTPTPLPPTPVPTRTPVPPTLTPTSTATATATLAPTPTEIPATPFHASFEEEEGNLSGSLTWRPWGNPGTLRVQHGDGVPQPSLLILSAASAAGEAQQGVTALPMFPLAEGVGIQFWAKPWANDTGSMVHMDWDPAEAERSGNLEPGPLHLAISHVQVELSARDAHGGLDTATYPLPGIRFREYVLTFGPDGQVSLTTDFMAEGEWLSVQMDPSFAAVAGRISFSGSGQIDQVCVTIPGLAGGCEH